MAQITYQDKVAINTNVNVADINKCNATDMNEIKNVVNTNDTNVGDLTTLNTYDKTSIVGAINEVNKKSQITIKLTSDYTIPNTNTAYDLTNMSVVENIGTKLSLVSGKVVIGSGVSKVKVSYTAKCTSPANTTRTFMYLMHYDGTNDTAISQEGAWFGGTGWQVNVSYSPRIISVNENDTFYLRCYGYKSNVIAGASSTFVPTIMTVEVIE